MTDSPGANLRRKLRRGGLIAPGVFNALVARCAALAGFEVMYISGGATANASGYPDIGLITLTEMTRTIREVAQASGGAPIIVDADTGHGEVESVIRTVIEYEHSGAAALHLEDQVFPKRCGHLEGKRLVPAPEMCEKVAAAAENRTSRDFIIIARTDAAGVEGLDSAIERARQYRAAGADMIFPEGLRSAEEFARFAKACPGLLLANMTEFGKTPQMTAGAFHELGYQVVIYPLSLMRLAMGEVERGLSALRERGSFESVLDRMQTRARLYETLGYEPGEAWVFPSPERRDWGEGRC
jgi:methylisocitrate lyase